MNTAVDLKTKIVRSRNQVSSLLGEEAILLNLESGLYYGLKGPGALVWKELEQERSLEELVGLVRRCYQVEAQRCRQDLLELVGELLRAGLVETRPSAEALVGS